MFGGIAPIGGGTPPIGGPPGIWPEKMGGICECPGGIIDIGGCCGGKNPGGNGWLPPCGGGG